MDKNYTRVVFGLASTYGQIRSEKEYKAAMKSIECLLEEAIAKGGFHKMGKEHADTLAALSKLAEKYEDTTLVLMPIMPKT